ncbi:hypothetical protein T4E_1106 [Trichinella pseudospiralis]|uniref:Uncharacterized protein n=1 Tax=Trichinella pseudospiralis TaxID=6337 RepID=A0A0V0Y5Z1_TRIPS|nr:hypothetical protein T4E_1106 [Trichinella pseudospiralis]
MVKLASFYYIPPFLNIPQGSICDLLSHEDHDYPCPYHERMDSKVCLDSAHLSGQVPKHPNCRVTIHFGAQHSRICDETDFTVENYCKALNALTVKSALNENSSSLYSVSMTINEWPRSVQCKAKERAANGRLACGSFNRTILQIIMCLATGQVMSRSAEGALPG